MLKRAARRFSSLRMQLVASVFVAIAPALALTYIVNQSWFWEYAPDWLRRYALDLPWASFSVGLLALMAAWFGGEHFILRQVRALSETAKRLSKGDLTARTGLTGAEGELGELAKVFDEMAASLQQRVKERELAEKKMLNRALQQTAVAAIGQFALTSTDLSALLQQAATLVAQTLEVDFCAVLERTPDGNLLLQADVGQKVSEIGKIVETGEDHGQLAFTLHSGEPAIVTDYKTETRFSASPWLAERHVIGSVSVAIPTRGRPYGVLTVHSTHRREFTPEEVQFLIAAATALGMAAERKQADTQLQKLAAFAQMNPNATMELAEDGTLNYFNEATEYLAASVQKAHPSELLPPDINEIIRECLTTGRSKIRLETKVNGRTFSWSFHPVPASRVVHGYAEDITDWLDLEAQLRQSQKMESVGQLAAGVAHDFNNMLTIIQGHSSSLLAKSSLPSVLQDPLQAVYFAAERAASLTRQLLMFSRKNVMQLKPLDVREVVGNMTKMLKRLLGEMISLEFHPPNELPVVQGDAGMIGQVVMNLSVNARDAMPRGGLLTISIETVQIDAGYVETHPESRAGRFIRLRVADTGCGMNSTTLSRIFEPFFTTKEVGRGTGLGLATVYGIVKQHEGWVEVSSELGKGSTFDVFFEANDLMAQFTKEKEVPPEQPVSGGNETILIVEDEPVLREMARVILEECGYRLVEASSGKEALDVWNRHSEKIHLLLTDMVMPEGVSGVELAEQLLAQNSQLKVVFTSGYTVDNINHNLLVKHNARFLQKPYSHADLAKIVRNTLDGKNSHAPVTT